MKLISNLINRFQFQCLRRTKKSRQVLRDQKIEFKGKKWLVMDYIDWESKRIPPMFQDGQIVDHHHRARQWYYKYDWKGVRYYFKALHRSIK
jgi:hypothetical protein